MSYLITDNCLTGFFPQEEFKMSRNVKGPLDKFIQLGIKEQTHEIIMLSMYVPNTSTLKQLQDSLDYLKLGKTFFVVCPVDICMAAIINCRNWILFLFIQIMKI